MGLKTIGRFVYDSTTTTTVPANGNIPRPLSTVSTNCLSCDGSTVTINRSGVYEVSANFSMAATAAGNVEIQMYRNGNAVPGAHAIATASAAADLVTQDFTAVVTVPCNSPTATVNFKSATGGSTEIANVIVIKVA